MQFHHNTPNVIFFGESGAGKSSVINMLDGGGVAGVSDQATGVTFTSSAFEKRVLQKPFTIFDTVGLNEGSRGTVKPKDAVERLYGLMNHLGDGINLLVYVMRAPRIKQTAELNYKMFFEIFCQKKVPIVILITGLENRDDMDGWWTENEPSFRRYGMIFQGHACITATKGRFKDGKYNYQDEYDSSKKAVERLISTSFEEPWKIERKAWLLEIIDKVLGLFETRPSVRRKQLVRALRKYGGLSSSDAEAEAKRIEARRVEQENIMIAETRRD